MIKTAALSVLCAIVGLSCAKKELPTATPDLSPDLADLSAEAGRSTNLLSVGAWSEPVTDSAGYTLRGRLLLFDTSHYTNNYGPPGPMEYWGNAPVYLELQNLSPGYRKSLAVYFALGDGFEYDLRDSQNNQIPPNPMWMFNGSIMPFTLQSWIFVPFDGSVRLRCDPRMGGTSPKPAGLHVQFSMSSQWLLPPGTNTCYLSGTFSPPTNHPPPPGSNHVWVGTLKLPPVKIDVPAK